MRRRVQALDIFHRGDFLERIPSASSIEKPHAVVTTGQVSEAGLGNEEAAQWDYSAARALMPDLLEVDLKRFGTAGERLETWRDSLEDRSKAAMSLGGGSSPKTTPPKKLRTDTSELLFRKRKACGEEILVQCIIDERGHLTQPQLLKGQDLLLGYAVLEEIRDWRFEPALLEGKPTAVIYYLEINLPKCSRLS